MQLANTPINRLSMEFKSFLMDLMFMNGAHNAEDAKDVLQLQFNILTILVWI